MKKRVLPLSIFLSIILMNFISAATFSLSDIFDKIDSDTMTIVFIFIVSFTLIFFSLNKLFKTNKTVAAVVSLTTSFFITYSMNKLDINISNWIYNIGLSEETLSILIPVLALAFAIFLVIQFKQKSLLLFGGVLIVLAFFVEESALLIVIGVVLLLFGFLSLTKKKGGSKLKRVMSNILDEFHK